MLNSGKFSLYSTDTEEQVASMSRGLDRCAALLKSLLSPEKQAASERGGGDVHQGEVRGRLSDKLSKRATSSTKVDQKTNKQSSSLSTDSRTRHAESAEPPFPGSSKHVRRPNACSTPRKNGTESRHVRSATEPKPVGDFQAATMNAVTDNHQTHLGEIQPSVGHLGNATTTATINLRPTRRKHVRAHRRLKSKPRHKRSRSVEGNKGCRTQYHDGDHRLVKLASESNAPTNYLCRNHGTNYSNVPNFYHYPHPHHYACCIPYASHYSSVPSHHPLTCTHCQPQPLPWAWPTKGGVWPTTKGGDYPNGPSSRYQRCNSAPSERACPTDNINGAPLPTTTATTSSGIGSGPSPSSSPHTNSGVQGIQLLTEEMMTTLQHNIDAIRKMMGPNGAVHQLETMEYSLKLYCSQLSLQCQKLLLSSGHSPSSPSSPLSPYLIHHWQTQLQQLEEEKSQLLERLISSETAYSEVKGQLDCATKREEGLRRELESSGNQILALKNEIEQTNKLIAQFKNQKKIAEEKLQDTQLSAKDSMKRERAKNEDLQLQIDILSKDLVKSKQEHLKECARLSQTQVSLDRALEEVQLMKLSLSEKDTQLLQSQDQQLGLRQCLAYFLSDLRLHHQQPSSSSSSTQPRGSYYTVSQGVVQKFQSLVNDGAIEQFLAKYTGRQEERSRENSHHLSLQDTLNDSQDFELGPSSPLSHLSDSSSTSVAHSLLQREKETERGDALSKLKVITPLLGAGAGRNDKEAEDLDSDSIVTVTSSNGDIDFPKEERLVEGSSVKSQPRTWKSHDFTTQSEDFNLMKKRRYPPGGGDEVKGRWVQSPSKSTLSSVQTSVTGTSCRTTASEAEFRSELDSLDADIARLQMQFRVARLTSLP